MRGVGKRGGSGSGWREEEGGAAVEVAEAFFGGGVAVAVEDAEGGGSGVGEAGGDFGAAFEVVG